MQVKIRISEEPGFDETEVLARCREMDEEVLPLSARLRVLDAKLTGERNGATCLLDAGQVLYADATDKRTFLYTAEGIYETALRLYGLEEQLAARDFIRAGKSVLLNFGHVASLRPDFGDRMPVTLSSGEQLMASRQYVPAIKAKLGIKK